VHIFYILSRTAMWLDFGPKFIGCPRAALHKLLVLSMECRF
jgi:hypothetical protein